MEETTTKKTKKVAQERGKSFPTLSLPESVKIIREAGVYGNTHHIDALATYAGHSTANSGAFRSKVAALKEWGLIVGNGETISLTDNAIQLANPVDQATTTKVLQDVFRSSELFWDVYTTTGKGAALSIDGIANKGVTTYKVNVKSKKNFAQSFIESAESVNLLERVGDKVRLLPLENDSSNEDESTTDLRTAADEDKSGNDGSKKKVDPEQRVIDQTWEFEGGAITFTLATNHPLNSGAYTYISDVIKKIESLESQLATQPISSEDEAQDDNLSD